MIYVISGDTNAGHLADQGTHQGTHGRHLVGPKEGWQGRPSRRLRQDQAHQTKFTRRPAPSLHSRVVGRSCRPACAPQQDRGRGHNALAARKAVLTGR